MFSFNSGPLPQRTYPVNVIKHVTNFDSIDEELRDCKRVQRHGQEEDLREALILMVARVEEMCETLKSSYQKTTDLETQLTLAESNLKLALANNEMLEDALKSGSLSKDVGWRRSARDTSFPQSAPSPATASLAASQSQPTSISENETQGAPDSPGSDRDSRAPSPAPTPQTDLRFFRFRLTGGGRSTPTQPPNSPPRASRSQSASHPAASHLTSASLPSLVAPPLANNGELDALREQLLMEKRKSEKITREKSELESELESLSQALFEEANQMVKVERIKRAEAEDELKEVHAEKEALKSALRLIEEDRMRIETTHRPHVNGIEPSQHSTVGTHSRSSSQQPVVSPRPGDSPTPPSPPPPSAQSPSRSAREVVISTNVRDTDDAPPSPAPLYVPPPHLSDSAPASRTGSPMPLPHPHRLSHLRTTAPPPAPPPPSAADGFLNSPWARAPFGEEDADYAAETSLSLPKIGTLYSPPSEAEMAVPWGK
ncbi:hypothetical protein F5148DRAFT_1194747 [Russula earlei]|uniref:Uncharacterized protein n=1 Tax=Russula earlei TaxID=71964 RepID=A0ACC0UC32_9AGAM|nr:hypothetical protein F5148DRAFT_1194747 [Russula earlei]